MTRRDRRKLHLAVIVFLAVGVFGSSAWLVLYDTRSGRIHASPDAAARTRPPGPSLRDVEADIKRVRRTIEPDGFLGAVLARYYLRAGRYPTTLSDLLERPANLDPAIRWDGPYVSNSGVLDDPWDRPYEYIFPGAHNLMGYDLWSIGPDGLNGTADDISNW